MILRNLIELLKTLSRADRFLILIKRLTLKKLPIRKRCLLVTRWVWEKARQPFFQRNILVLNWLWRLSQATLSALGRIIFPIKLRRTENKSDTLNQDKLHMFLWSRI